MRLFRALPECFCGRTKRTFARRETDVNRLRLGYEPQKFYPPTENISEAIGGERDTAAGFDRGNNAIHAVALLNDLRLGFARREDGVNEVAGIGDVLRDQAHERFAGRLLEWDNAPPGESVLGRNGQARVLMAQWEKTQTAKRAGLRRMKKEGELGSAFVATS